ncbi:MAG: hypothetical protein N2647_06185 [Thermodesulfovibrio sp.]|nr:hypothetical protein [Thermodesulfovibrio sp.]
MIEGLFGIFLAFLIFILVLFFGKRKPNQKIAILLNKAMSSQGFINLNLSEPIIQSIREAFKFTAPYQVFIEQAFYRPQDDLIICWISTNTESNNNTLVSVIPQKIKTGKWILLYLPSMQGRIGNIARKAYELSLSSAFNKVKPEIFGQLNKEFDIFIKNNETIPLFHMDFFNVIKQFGNTVIRSSGSFLLIERLSVIKNETWAQEIKELSKITQLIKDMI